MLGIKVVLVLTVERILIILSNFAILKNESRVELENVHIFTSALIAWLYES